MGLKRRPPGDDIRRVQAINGNIRGTVTNKVGRIVQYESFAERSLLLRLDRNLQIQDYASQPETVIYTTPDGKSHRYTPDFIVWTIQGQIEIHEVTRKSRTDLASQQARMAAAHSICRERGWCYIVHTEDDLPQGAELSNLLLLIAYRPAGYTSDMLRTWLVAQPHQAKLFDDLVQSIKRTALPFSGSLLPALYHEIWHGRIDIDWQRLLLRDGQPDPGMLVTYGRRS